MSTARERSARSSPIILLAALTPLSFAVPGAAQSVAGSADDAAAAAGGAALGGLSGLTLGLVGGVPPCSLALDGATCARVVAAVGGAIGAGGGGLLAYRDPDALHGRLIGAGIGAAAGAALGLAGRAVVRQLEPRDIATLAVAGAAVGAVPVGSGIGLGVGLLAGSALWLALEEHGLPETVALGVTGMALGGLMEWAYAAVEAEESRPLVLRMTFGL